MPKETAKMTRPRKQIRHDEMQGDQRDIHEQRCHRGLYDTDNRGLLSGLLQGGKPELMADGEGDEAQGHIGDHRKGVHLFKGIEPETGDTQPAQHARPDEHAGHQIGGYVRQMKLDKQTGHKKPREQGDCDQQQGLHKRIPLPFNPYTLYISKGL